jgi:hypothetical protein
LDQLVPLIDELCWILQHQAEERQLEPADTVKQRQGPALADPGCSVKRLNHERLTVSRSADQGVAGLALQSPDPCHEPSIHRLRSLFNHKNQSLESIN